MYAVLKTIHSYWAYLVLLILVVAIINAFVGKSSGRDFGAKDLRISLFGLIFFSHSVAYWLDPLFCFPLV